MVFWSIVNEERKLEKYMDIKFATMVHKLALYKIVVFYDAGIIAKKLCWIVKMWHMDVFCIVTKKVKIFYGNNACMRIKRM